MKKDKEFQRLLAADKLNTLTAVLFLKFKAYSKELSLHKLTAKQQVDLNLEQMHKLKKMSNNKKLMKMNSVLSSKSTTPVWMEVQKL